MCIPSRVNSSVACYVVPHLYQIVGRSILAMPAFPSINQATQNACPRGPVSCFVPYREGHNGLSISKHTPECGVEPLPRLSLNAIIVGRRELRRIIIRARGCASASASVRRGSGANSGAVLGVCVKHVIGAGRLATVAVGVAEVIGAVGVGMAVLVAGEGIVVVHVDTLIGLVVMGRHGEGRLVGINVLTTTDFAVVVTREVAVELVILHRVSADERRKGEEQAGFGLAMD